MPAIEIIMPSMGEGIIEATLLKWLKNEGDSIQLDENLVEVATDKVNSEVPSSTKGILVKKLYKEKIRLYYTKIIYIVHHINNNIKLCYTIIIRLQIKDI